MDKKIQEDKFKKCFDNQYQMKFYKHVDDEGNESTEWTDWKYGSYSSINKSFSRKYGDMSFFVDQNGFLY